MFTTLAQCLLLAVPLHLLLVLHLGSAPEGTARPGEGVWGAINVTLRGPALGAAQGVVAPLPEQAGPPGATPSTRQGGAVRKAPLSLPGPPPTPGAARLGDWDCRNASSGVGVLVVVQLLVESVRKDGCKW